jgi:hypothetical protein
LPSPYTNPETQCESGILLVLILGMLSGIVLINLYFTISEKPKFIDALRLIKLCKPSVFRWKFLLLSSTILFNKLKSAFWFNNLYKLKWGRVILIKYFVDSTEYNTQFLVLCSLIVPIPPNNFCQY